MKNKIYELIVDIWRLASKYQFRCLSDTEWEAFVSDGLELCSKYRKEGPGVERLCRSLFGDIQEFYEMGISGDEK